MTDHWSKIVSVPLLLAGVHSVFMTQKYNNVRRVGGNLALLVCIIPIMGGMVSWRKNNFTSQI